MCPAQRVIPESEKNFFSLFGHLYLLIDTFEVWLLPSQGEWEVRMLSPLLFAFQKDGSEVDISWDSKLAGARRFA